MKLVMNIHMVNQYAYGILDSIDNYLIKLSFLLILLSLFSLSIFDKEFNIKSISNLVSKWPHAGNRASNQFEDMSVEYLVEVCLTCS